MLEYTVFNDWYYGTDYDALDENKINIGVFNPAGIKSLLKRSDCNVKVFWISTSDKTRLLRQLNREENPNVKEIIRRYTTDKEDFGNIDFGFTILLNNDNNDIQRNIKEILSQVESKFAQGQT